MIHRFSFRLWSWLAAAAVMFGLAGCETPTTQRYSVLPDNNVALRAMNLPQTGVRPFTSIATFDANCRALGPLQVADGIGHVQYIQKAFEDELKLAGLYSAATAKNSIGGTVRRLEFSSSRGITGGSWLIDISLSSTNGRHIDVVEYYEFQSGFVANDACKATADAYLRAVQNLIGKALKHPDFAALTR